MDVLALRVYNDMHDLGLTEEQLKAIESEAISTNRGIANMALSKDGKFIIYIDHDEKNCINVKRCKKKVPIPSRVLTRVLIDFEPPEEAHTIHLVSKYRTKDWEWETEAHNVAELKTALIDRLSSKTSWSLGDMSAVFWLFDAPYAEFVKCKPRRHFTEIVKVFQTKNRRLAVFKHATTECDREQAGIMYYRDIPGTERTVYQWGVQTFKPNDEEYNFVDEGREIFGDVWLADEFKGRLDKKEMEVIDRKVEGKFAFLDQAYYGRVQNELRAELMSAKREDQVNAAKAQFKSTAEKDFRAGKEIYRNGIKFSTKKIDVDGYAFSGSRIGEYILKQNLLYAEGLTFQTLVEGYVDFVCEVGLTPRNYYNDTPSVVTVGYKCGKSQLAFGEVKLELDRVGDVYYVNERRVRKMEMPDIVKMASRVKTQAEYDAYLDLVRAVPLEVQEKLAKGVDIFIEFIGGRERENDNDLLPDGKTILYLNLKLERENNTNYVVVGGERHRIKDMPMLCQINKPHKNGTWQQHVNDLNRFCSMFMRAVDIPPAKIVPMIREGKQAYLDKTRREREELAAKVARSQEFIQHAIEVVKATPRKLKMDGHIVSGWEVKSMSGHDYFVSKDGGCYAFNTPEDLEHLCIVDTTRATQEYEKNDSIAKRLLALHHDSKTASGIYTLENYLKKNEVMN